MPRASWVSFGMGLLLAVVALAVLVGPLGALATVLGSVVLIALVWALYLAVRRLDEARDEGVLTPTATGGAYVLITLGLPFYVLLNWTVASALFLDLPRVRMISVGRFSIPLPEPQFTRRCQHYIDNGSGWRRDFALWWCRNFLDPFQRGGHC